MGMIMKKDPKKIKLFPYDPKWPKMFDVEAKEIKEFLKESCVKLHHIGSTSIPNMTAKEDLDILLIVSNLKDSLKLEKHGFIFKGELNIPLRYFFSKNTQRSKINLHVCEKGHAFADLNLTFRDYLRTHPKEAEEYAQLKLKALENPNAHHRIRWFLSKYGEKKDPFIKKILKKANYQGININFCMHNNEWEEYHRIKDEQFFKNLDVEYDRNHPSFTEPEHFHFCLYQGGEVVGIAHIELLSEEKAALRPLCIDTPYQKKGLGKYFLIFLERWLELQGIRVLHLHARIDAIPFYEKQGYEFMPFNDPTGGLPSKSKDMGKTLRKCTNFTEN